MEAAQAELLACKENATALLSLCVSPYLHTEIVKTKPHLAKVPCFTIHIEATCIWLQPGGPQCLLDLLHVAHPASARDLEHQHVPLWTCHISYTSDSSAQQCSKMVQRSLGCRQHVACIHSCSLLMVVNRARRT